ncbi:MAG: hypothetical protein ACSW77_00655 [Bacteroidales bacterium]
MKAFKYLLASVALLTATCMAAQEMPRLSKTNDGRIQLLVNGQPFIALSGELHNSTTGSTAYMTVVWHTEDRPSPLAQSRCFG